MKTDVSKASDVEAMVQFTVDTYGRLDAAVNNAARTRMTSRWLIWMKMLSMQLLPWT